MLRRVFIYLLLPRWHSKSFRTASRFPMPTTPEQPDFAHSKFLVFCSLQPTKSACSAAAEKCLSSVGQPLSSVSGRQRYNTLDFASKIVCQQGCFSPLLETQSRGIASLWHPHIFFANGTQTVKMQFDTFPQKIQNRCTSHPCEDEEYSGFLFIRRTLFVSSHHKLVGRVKDFGSKRSR